MGKSGEPPLSPPAALPLPSSPPLPPPPSGLIAGFISALILVDAATGGGVGVGVGVGRVDVAEANSLKHRSPLSTLPCHFCPQ